MYKTYKLSTSSKYVVHNLHAFVVW